MPNFGNTGTPSSGYFFDDRPNFQWWSLMGAFPAGGGTITGITVQRCAGDGVTGSGKLVVWDNTNILAQGSVSIPSGSQSVGGQGNLSVSGLNVWVKGGTNINIGLWANCNIVFTYEGSGVVFFQNAGSGGPTTLSNQGNEAQALGAFLTYTAGGGVYRMVASAFGNAGPAEVLRTNMTQGIASVMRAGVWVRGN